MKRIRRPRRAPDPEPLPKVENPELFLAWVWCEPQEAYDAPHLRGGPIFEAMADMGLRVQVIPQTATGEVAQVTIRRPWTIVFATVPAADFTSAATAMADDTCSVIMDCYWPIMNMEQAIGTDDQIIGVIDHKDVLLANLALADVVTVPHARWAEQLAEVNPNVHILPDYEDDQPERFALRLQEIAQASIRVKQARQAARREMGL